VRDDVEQGVPADVEGDLSAVDDDLLDHGAVVRVGERGEPVVHLVEPAAERGRRGARHHHRPGQSAVAARVAGAPDAEHALADVDDLELAGVAGHQLLLHLVGGVLRRAGRGVDGRLLVGGEAFLRRLLLGH
jgi:hypothetical protein